MPSTKNKTPDGPFSKPWLYFLVFGLITAALAWSPLTVLERIWVFPLGFILQVTLAFLAFPPAKAREEPLYQSESFASPSLVFWFLTLGLAVFLRLFGLRHLFAEILDRIRYMDAMRPRAPELL